MKFLVLLLAGSLLWVKPEARVVTADVLKSAAAALEPENAEEHRKSIQKRFNNLLRRTTK